MLRFSSMIRILFITLLFCCQLANAQDFALENTRENVAYAGIPSYLKCVINGYPARAVRLTTNNGTITVLPEQPGSFQFVPAKPGPVNLEVWVQTGKNKKKIGNHPYRIRIPPPARVWLVAATGSKVCYQKILILPQLIGMCFPYDCVHTNPAYVQSYSVTAFKNDSCLFTFHNNGYMLEEANIAKIETLAAGTELLFHNILVKLGAGYEQTADDIRYTLTSCEEQQNRKLIRAIPDKLFRICNPE